MTPPLHFAVVSRTNRADPKDIKRWCNACHKQLQGDYKSVWGRTGTVEYFASEHDVPMGYVKCFIQEKLDEPGAAGYHTDEHNQPVIYVQFDGDATSVTMSHEFIETVGDPFGNRLITRDIQNFGKCRILVEECDPPENFTYTIDGAEVSDFITPEWYDQEKQDGVKYSFLDTIEQPGTIREGGYYSFMDHSGTWHQQTYFSGPAPIYTTLGKREEQKGGLREWVDAKTMLAKAKAKEVA